ncbi:sulfotransferase family protein [Magnetococcus sp. PR-3]|uniref:sulfotransferase family protein n=1 Tax=Magnetococcus sp. PR-3 TaxID=3120355 RepID=UPI002FCDEF23
MDPMSQAPNRPNYLFVGGAAKSGTTWLQKIINSHPQMICKGEGKFLFLFLGLDEVRKLHDAHQNVGPEFSLNNTDRLALFSVACERILERYWQNEPGILWVGDKSTENSLTVELCSAVFPSSRFIYIVRDPRDAAVSGWHQNVREQNASFIEQGFDKDMMAFSRFATEISWMHAIEKAYAFEQRMPNNAFRIHYEQLLLQPNEIVTDLFNFLTVNSDIGLVEEVVQKNLFKNVTGRNPGDESKTSDARKGIAGDWKNHMTEAQGQEILDLTKGLAQKLGYQ